jgi:hypothetical protein
VNHEERKKLTKFQDMACDSGVPVLLRAYGSPVSTRSPSGKAMHGLVRTVALEIVSAILISESFAVQDVLETYTSIPPWPTAWNVPFGY